MRNASADERLRMLSSVVEQTADMVMITDRHGFIDYVNPAFETTTGYIRDEILGQSASRLRSGKHSKAFYAGLWETILAGRVFRSMMINRKKSGELFFTQKTITPLVDEAGRVTHFVSTDKDVTDRELAEQRARALQRRFTELFNYAADGMAYCKLDGTLVEVNAAFSRLTGYSKEELENHMKYQDISNSQCWRDGNRLLEAMLRTQIPTTQEKEYRRKNGSLLPALVTAFPVKSDDATIVTAVGTIVKDISELKEKQRQLEATARELERSNRELEQFAWVASHDLQEPLRTITTYLGLLEQSSQASLNETSKQQLHYVIESAGRLRGLVSDLLAYATSGREPGEFVEVDTETIVREVLGGLKQVIDDTGATIQVHPLPKLVGHPRRVAQLFQNLISNALKYRSESAPRIEISAERGPKAWTFRIADNGLGIPPDSAQLIFEPFKRLHSRARIPGTGIGLAICRKIVEQGGGQIRLESSSPGHGSVFAFTFPDPATGQSVADESPFVSPTPATDLSWMARSLQSSLGNEA